MTCVYKYNHVFDHVETMLHSIYDKDPKYDDAVFILGYNMMKDFSIVDKTCPGKRKIVYQLEQLHTGSPYVTKKNHELLMSADEVWDYDESNINWHIANRGLKSKFKPIVYVPQLNVLEPLKSPDQCDIDVLFVGALSDRRNATMRSLHMNRNLRKVFNVFGVWGNELNTLIRRSKIILNVHYFDPRVSIQEQVRMFFPVINNCCVLSEENRKNYMGDSIIEVEYTKIAEACAYLIEKDRWFERANKSAERFKKECDLRR